MEAINFRQQLRKTCMEYMVLHTIKRKPSYAPDIIATLKRANLIVVEGTLYPLLTRLKNNGMLSYIWQESTQGPPRKYYSLTDDGQALLAAMDQEYENIKTIIDFIDTAQNPEK
ncbi:MAG: PadR family transcriptional regulator [Paludibacteraceae bacterium]